MNTTKTANFILIAICLSGVTLSAMDSYTRKMTNGGIQRMPKIKPNTEASLLSRYNGQNPKLNARKKTIVRNKARYNKYSTSQVVNN